MSVYFLLHIPKTAGIAIAEHLAQNCAAGMFWRPERRMLGATQVPPQADRIRAVALGHYHGRSLERFFEGREIRRIVLMRDPVDLQISYYNWRMMYFQARGQGTYSFDLHLRSLPRNFMTHFLLRRWLELSWPTLLAMSDPQKLELVQRHLAQFWFVGAHTDCGMLLDSLASNLSIPAAAARRNSTEEWRNVVAWTPLTADQLSVSALNLMLADHPLDRILWETWHTARFDARNVHPYRGVETTARGAWHRGLQRPVFEAARLWRRSIPRRLPGAPPIMALHDAIAASPQRREVWLAYMTDWRRNRAGAALPESVMGSAEQTHDPQIALMKAELLLSRRRHAEAARYLRLAPALASTRREAGALTSGASVLDYHFRKLVFQADRARNRGSWRAAAALYRAGLDLYPGHSGYMVQYAHCLKEQGDDGIAEIYYRSARSLGAPFKDVSEEVIAVAARQGHNAALQFLAERRPSLDGTSFLDDPPTRADIELVASIHRDNTIADTALILSILRSTPTIRDVIAGLVTTGTDAEFSVAAACKKFLLLHRSVAVKTACCPRPNMEKDIEFENPHEPALSRV